MDGACAVTHIFLMPSSRTLVDVSPLVGHEGLLHVNNITLRVAVMIHTCCISSLLWGVLHVIPRNFCYLTKKPLNFEVSHKTPLNFNFAQHYLYLTNNQNGLETKKGLWDKQRPRELCAKSPKFRGSVKLTLNNITCLRIAITKNISLNRDYKRTWLDFSTKVVYVLST